MKIAIGNDHVAVEMKNYIKSYLEVKGYEVIDFGTNTAERTDYPIYSKKVARAVVSGECEFGILICGTGVGISIAANKIKGIRAAHVTDSFSARMTKMHNNANVICLGERITGLEIASDIVNAYLNAEFEGGRHEGRVNKLMSFENK